MTGKKKAIIAGAVLLLLGGSLAIYWFYFSEPNALPGQDQMITEINGLLPEADAWEIQETIMVDNEHAVAPFTSKDGIYGVSSWVWKHHEWKLGSVRTNGEPKIWKVDPDDPATYRIVWNIDPAEESLDTLNFFFVRERYWSVSGDRHQYDPSIQLKKEVSFREHPYGVMKLPDDWTAVVESGAEGNPREVVHRSYPGFQWIPLDENGEETFLDSAVNGSSYHTGLVEEEHMMIVNLEEVE
ncbi:hypothetical protein V6B33_00175 [Mangrovibacillus sp. Mu-81]|uniref:hypothetical protein n=1 Tax=Mangrovibacillus sp. Mu-81 TaxID=3121478 RepID=UPI002FE4A086